MSAVGAHRGGADALSEVALPVLSAGMMLGRDRQREPYVVRAFGPRPMLITLLGGVWLARIVTFRALALGARLVVHPGAAPMWNGFAEAATGGRDRTTILEPARLGEVTGAPHRPVWFVGEGGERPLGPWQTTLSMLPQLSVGGVRLVLDADLVVATTLTEPEATLATTALRLHPDQTGYLQAVSGETIAAFGGPADPYFHLGLTEVEKRMFGPPTRQ
jgi:hypothetical protein